MHIPEGPAYPIRTITDGTYRYIKNLLPDEIYIEKHLMGVAGDGLLNNPYWSTWIWNSWDNSRTYALVKRYMHRPAEELYHNGNDPYEMINLMGDDSKEGLRRKLGAALAGWMQSQGDPGIALDTFEAIRAARQGRHLYHPSHAEE